MPPLAAFCVVYIISYSRRTPFSCIKKNGEKRYLPINVIATSSIPILSESIPFLILLACVYLYIFNFSNNCMVMYSRGEAYSKKAKRVMK